MVAVRDVDGTTTRSILEDQATVYALWWSPDRRHIIANGSIAGRPGYWLLSTLGGRPRYLSSYRGFAAFFAGGDSLLVGVPSGDSLFWIRVSGPDGVPRDSIAVVGPTDGYANFYAIAGTSWIAIQTWHSGSRSVLRVLDRTGVTLGEREFTDAFMLRASHDAVWVQVGNNAAIVRTALDSASGTLSAHSDTLVIGTPASDARGLGTYDVTADGRQMVFDNGTFAYDIFALDWPDVARGQLPDRRRILQTSSQVWLGLAPGGNELVVVENEAGATGKQRLSLLPFAGGGEAPLLSSFVSATGGVFAGVVWPDSATVAVATREGAHTRLERVHVRTAARTDGLTLPVESLWNFDWLAPEWLDLDSGRRPPVDVAAIR